MNDPPVDTLPDDRLKVVWQCSVNLAKIVGRHGDPRRADYYTERARLCEEEATKRGMTL